jgi:hypothetical protein
MKAAAARFLTEGGSTMTRRLLVLAVTAMAVAGTTPALGGLFTFSTGNPDGLMGTASRPGGAGILEIESADDFITTATTSITGATFTGLFTGGATSANIGSIDVEIYRVFPVDSNVGRTSGPPTFSTPNVPTRVNSPSDVEFVGRDSATNGLTFNCTLLAASFTVSNSVVNGINPKPNQTTGGDGAATGQEIECSVTFTTPFLLPADHYFFVPQVGLSSGTFLWLSAPRPLVPPGTPFAPDLQSWIRNANLDPDWLRIGTDIVGGTTPPTFNAVFSLVGQTVPEPGTVALLLVALCSAFTVSRRVRARAAQNRT